MVEPHRKLPDIDASDCRSIHSDLLPWALPPPKKARGKGGIVMVSKRADLVDISSLLVIEMNGTRNAWVK
jgi:hypothetical protein